MTLTFSLEFIPKLDFTTEDQPTVAEQQLNCLPSSPIKHSWDKIAATINSSVATDYIENVTLFELEKNVHCTDHSTSSENYSTKFPYVGTQVDDSSVTGRAFQDYLPYVYTSDVKNYQLERSPTSSTLSYIDDGLCS